MTAQNNKYTGVLELEDNSKLKGESFGSRAFASGEVVFTTGMVGYPETLTDPSYSGQILVFTYPLIGNYGVPKPVSFESKKIQAAGVIVSEGTKNPNHITMQKTFPEWLKENNIPGLAGVDTRQLTKKLRSKGVMNAKLYFTPKQAKKESVKINSKNLAAEVSCKQKITYRTADLNLLLVDCGVKLGIIRALLKRGAGVTRVPWDWEDFTGYDGIIISNGPGNPKTVKQTIANLKPLLKTKIPLLGICLGNQLCALAAGGDTFKLSYGHRSHNQPVLDKQTGQAYLTLQNHGYAVNMDTLDHNWEEWFINLNDKTNEGIKHKHKPIRAVQFHPEGHPGPDDTSWIFDQFIKLCRQYSS